MSPPVTINFMTFQKFTKNKIYFCKINCDFAFSKKGKGKMKWK